MSPIYTTYAITDPRTSLFCYVGQTADFERRRRGHLKAHRLKKPPRGSVKAWLKQLHNEGHAPYFTVLEVVETEAMSLESENLWVEKLSALGHPLLNRWDEHKELLQASPQGIHATLRPMLFGRGTPKNIGRVEPNASKTGFRVHVDQGVELIGPITIDLLPPKTG